MIEKLKNSVEKKFGKKISCQKDCKTLSSSILEASNEYISPATLRRLYGFLITNSNPSRVTHDILCRYIGFKDWEQFVELNRENTLNNQNVNDEWVRVSEKSKKITLNTLETLKQKSGISFSKTIERKFADERLTFFLNSDYNSTAFIGPGGYGKSTTLIKWVEKRLTDEKSSNDIILFIQALTFNSFANSESYFEDWLIRQIGLSSDYNFLRNLKSNNNPEGKLIIIIDGLDETNLQGSKLEKIYTSIADFSLKFSSNKWFKLIISTRFYAWSRFKPYIENGDKWYHVEQQSFSIDGANMPLLTSDEIQRILDNTANSSFQKRTFIDELSVELRETLSYPYFLQLFINVYHPENEYLLNDQIEIFKEFINKQIYNASYSEEKSDIINKILELSDYGLEPNGVKKNSLKEIYPIHLKLGGNYYAAYEDLISFGIIAEDDIENKFGSHLKIVRIANTNLYEILIAKSLLEKDEDISILLLKQVEDKYADSEILSHIIIRLYQFAYKGRILKPLINFFDLKESTLRVVLSSPQLAISLRKDEYLRKHLLPIYASIPVARKYFYEDFPDFNNIASSFSASIDYYLKHYDTEEEEINGCILNLYSAILSIDEGKIKRFYNRLKDFKPNKTFNPNIMGKWFASKYIYHYMLKNETSQKTLNEALAFLKAFRESKNYRYGQFESTFYCALIITNQFQTLSKLVKQDAIIESNRSSEVNNEYKLFLHISNVSSGKRLGLKDIIGIDQILSQLNPLDSHLNMILGLTLKATFYLNNNEMANAYSSFRNATELSNLAGLKLVEVKLMKNLASVLLRLGEKTKSAECGSFAEQLIYKTGFKYELF